jgi:hypothetical protein
MLIKHIDKVRQKSEDFRMVYAFMVSLLFTGVVTSFWVFSAVIPDFSGVSNSASVSNAIDGSKDLSPTGVVKQEAGNVFDSFWDTVKGIKNDSFQGGQFEVKPTNSTSSGITVEADNTNENLNTNDGVLVPNGVDSGNFINTSESSDNVPGN